MIDLKSLALKWLDKVAPLPPERPPLLPGSFKMHPHTYAIDVSKQARDQMAEAEAVGLCIAHELRILIDTRVPLEMLSEVVLHEVLHAAWSQAGLDGELEEQAVSALAPRLLDVLRTNPRLVALFT